MRSQQGFTLIELLVAMTVFSFMLLIIVGGFMNIVTIHNAALASNQAQDSVRTAMDDMVQAVRDSTGVEWIHTYPSYSGTMSPGVPADTNYDVVCLDNASGGPLEYFVRALPTAGSNRQLWVRSGVDCSTTALTNPPAATDVPLTSPDQSVQAFQVKQVPDPSLTPPTPNWKPQVEITLAMGSGNGTTTGNGINTQCNANQSDRAFCSTAVLTSGAAPR